MAYTADQKAHHRAMQEQLNGIITKPKVKAVKAKSKIKRPAAPGFLNAEVIKIKPRLVFGSEGKKEYFAVSFEERLLGSMVHLHIRCVGEVEKALEQRPYHTWLLADCPDWARNAATKPAKKKKPVSKKIKLANRKAYEALTEAKVHWTRIGPNKIQVYMSSDGNGSHHEELDKIKTFLESFGMFEFDRDFDRMCGKGFSVFRHK